MVIKDDHGTILPLCITPSMAMAYILLLLNFVVNVCLENNTKSCAKEKHNQNITTKTHLLSAITLTKATRVMHAEFFTFKIGNLVWC